ncbi:MAG: hypothetical protein ACRC6X_07490 [Culicoidibacterales bacterium]
MINEKKKIGKMIDELTTFFLKKGHWDLRIDIKYTKTETTLSITVPNLSVEEGRLIKECFSQKRDCTMEEYGWELMGESETSSELNLLGMCIDSFTMIDAGNDKTAIEILRKHD